MLRTNFGSKCERALIRLICPNRSWMAHSLFRRWLHKRFFIFVVRITSNLDKKLMKIQIIKMFPLQLDLTSWFQEQFAQVFHVNLTLIASLFKHTGGCKEVAFYFLPSALTSIQIYIFLITNLQHCFLLKKYLLLFLLLPNTVVVGVCYYYHYFLVTVSRWIQDDQWQQGAKIPSYKQTRVWKD